MREKLFLTLVPLRQQVSLQGLVILQLSLVETFPIRHPAVDTLYLTPVTGFGCARM